MVTTEASLPSRKNGGDRGPDQPIIKEKVPLQAAPSGLIGPLSWLPRRKSNETASTSSLIPPGKKPKENIPSPSTTPASWKIQQKGPGDYERDRVGEYAQYFLVILPIPEISKVLESRILYLVVTDLKTRRLTGLKKDTFEEPLLTAVIPCQYFCRRSFAIYDVLLPTKEHAAKIAGSNIMTKFFRLQLKYMGARRVRVTVCNIPAFLTGEILASFLSAYGCVQDVSQLQSAVGTAYGDYVFRTCLTRDGFQAIPDTILSQERQMMVVVEGRRTHCWKCKQIGHLAKTCPQKYIKTTDTTKEKPLKEVVIEMPNPAPKPEVPSSENGWTQVIRKKRKGNPPQNQRSYPKLRLLELRLPKLLLLKPPANQYHQPPKTPHAPGEPTDRKPQQRTPPWKQLTI